MYQSVVDSLTGSGTSTGSLSGTCTSAAVKKAASATTRRQRQPILIPVLEEAVAYTNDIFWKERLQNASRGKFPRCFYHRDGYIVYSRKGKERKINIPSSPEEAVAVFIEFLQEAGGIKSDRDIAFAKTNSEFNGETRELEYPTWAKITTKRGKSALLEKYCTVKTKEFDLDKDSSARLRSILFIALRIGIINKKTVQMDKGDITSIDGILRDEITNTFYIDSKLMQEALARLNQKSGTVCQHDLAKLPHSMYGVRGFAFSGEWGKYVGQYNSTYKRVQPKQIAFDFEMVVVDEQS